MLWQQVEKHIKLSAKVCFPWCALGSGRVDARDADMEENQRQSRSPAAHTQSLVLLVASPVPSRGWPRWESGKCSVLLLLTLCCPEAGQTGPSHYLTAGPLSARVHDGAAWVESRANFRPGDSLPTAVAGPRQLGWMAGGESQPPCREPWTQPSRSALGGIFLPQPQLWGSLVEGSATQRVGP